MSVAPPFRFAPFPVLSMPRAFPDVDDLEDELSRPDAAVSEALRDLDGPLVVLGAGGKMGPTLARMAARAGAREVVAVARFGDDALRARLAAQGVRTVRCDLLDRRAVAALPDARAVLFLAGQKFGTHANPGTTWRQNAVLPSLAAERYPGVPTVVFSSGNVYPFVAVDGPGAREDDAPAPVGEYAWSVLARERIYEDACERLGTPVVLYRLNYACEPRYGVLVDIACAVRDGRPIALATGFLNTIWQRDANAFALRCLPLAARPPCVLNVTGTSRVAVRDVAAWFAERFGKPARFTGDAAPTALLSDASRMAACFGAPPTSMTEMLDAVASWVEAGGVLHGKPTHYEVRDGSF